VTEPLAWVDVVPLLEAVADVDAILIGGQALDLWCEKYLDRDELLRSLAPFTSKDVDFRGDRDSVLRLAERLDGEALLPPLSDFDAVNAGIVTYRDPRGVERTLNVLLNVYGLDTKEAIETALPIELPSGRMFRVLHPVLCMFSRFANLADLRPESPVALRQARASVACCRLYIHDVVEEGSIEDALALGEKIFEFARSSRDADAIYGKHRIEPFSAVQPWPALPEPFRTRRYPQMQKQIESRQRKHHRDDSL
jgi:hypothetical protein